MNPLPPYEVPRETTAAIEAARKKRDFHLAIIKTRRKAGLVIPDDLHLRFVESHRAWIAALNSELDMLQIAR